MAKISVLMSVYWSETGKNLDRAIQSVWTDQTIKPFEIVLIEDGVLTDDLYSVIALWKNKLEDKLVILKNDVNLGLTKSLNRGINVVRGDFIARMDSDDISTSNRFERQIEFLEKNPDIDILGGALKEFDETSDCLRIRRYPLTHNEVVKYISKASPLAHPTVMMRRKMFDAGLRYNEKYKTSQDIALWFDAILAGYKIGNVQDVTINFRSEGDVFRRRSRSKAWNEFKIYVNGIYRMNGLITFKYIFPILRLFFRLTPPKIVELVYKSEMRTTLLEKR
ncbi:MAG: glycosyltransferase [Bacteroidales bacterium]|jgi:glycosyltransferase involved in cell wall biosynthesis|nr:glycosyltransferase [Bacteroidales bacterium]